MLSKKGKINLLLIFVVTVSMCSIILFSPKSDKDKLSFNKTRYDFLMKK